MEHERTSKFFIRTNGEDIWDQGRPRNGSFHHDIQVNHLQLGHKKALRQFTGKRERPYNLHRVGSTITEMCQEHQSHLRRPGKYPGTTQSVGRTLISTRTVYKVEKGKQRMQKWFEKNTTKPSTDTQGWTPVVAP